MIDDFVGLFWKHRDRGSPRPLVAGYGHQIFPEELIVACGLDALNLLVGGNEAWQTRGIDYLTPTACVLSRQMIGLFDTAREKGLDLPAIKAMVHTNFCSGDWHSLEILREYYAVNLLPLVIPYKATPHALKLLSGSLRLLANKLAVIAGMEFNPERLIVVLEQKRQLQDAIARYARMQIPGVLKIRHYHEIASCPWEKRVNLTGELITAASKSSDSINIPGINIVLTGSPVLVGDPFCSILDALDVNVRFFDFHFADQLGLHRVPAEPNDIVLLKKHVDFSDPIQVLAAYYLEIVAPERMVQGITDHLINRARAIMDYSRFLPHGQKIDGVISHVLKFCDVFGTDRAPFKAMMQDKYDIPLLDIERDYSASSIGQISTRIEAFKEILVARKKLSNKTR